MSSVRSCQKILLHAVKSMPTISKIGLLLVKAKPAKSGTSAFGITDLRKKLNPATEGRGRNENI